MLEIQNKMKFINSYFLFPLLALVLVVFALSNQMFGAFPLGKLMQPFVGAVQNSNNERLNATRFTISGQDLSDSVTIFFDERKVPHIYAKNTQDLYYAQGYVTAYLRLWQMDFLSYVAAGRLSEVFDKEDFLEIDRNQKRLGIEEAAKKSLTMMEKDPETNQVLTAYTRGVNAYIGELNYKTMPFEYKMLDYSPEPWTKLKSALILKNMANALSGYGEDLFMSKIFLALGKEKFGQLYPEFHSHMSPMMSATAVGPPQNAWPAHNPGYLTYSFLSANSLVAKSAYNPKLGSNSWAVSGKKTKSGFPILASDPHLGLSLPAIWVEMQLSAPGMNVYGVSLPGTPAVIIGFNEKIAWGITNGADDVKDWYRLKISDDYKKYELDGQWIDLKFRVEQIKRRGHAPFLDTVYSTVHGPVVNDKKFNGSNADLVNCALKWELHQPSNEFLAFIKLNKAGNYPEFENAIRNYRCPVQNFTFIAKDNTIAVDHQGSVAVKWYGQGKFILDGTQRKHIYTKYIKDDSLPKVHNPVSNYVLSANQHPTSPSFPYYYNGYFSETRANRIHQLLQQGNSFDIADMEAMQLDNVNFFAELVMPLLLQHTDQARLTANQRQLLAGISTWKGAYDVGDQQALLYELWWKQVRDYTWDELAQYSFFMRPPEDYVLLDLIKQEPNSQYFDKIGTSKKESAIDIITQAFVVATREYTKYRKEGIKSWADFNKVNVMHMTNIPAFSKMDLASAGNPEALNAISAEWGPSWRMVVELGDRPKAYGIYPGGQSGNIGSPNYDNFVGDWQKGKYYPLHLFLNQQEAEQNTNSTWTLKK
ncbi:penicillin acylase family protein [Hymenobacter rubripertinctus]|uniref:penicillin acylase family protein n=1 Tax=Hymenobacter rubripertinctus TaxID=2029981 RepID=UPI0015FF912E|nr:penicillin acylase family protein [Hymenobacter rubripertinctus]